MFDFTFLLLYNCTKSERKVRKKMKRLTENQKMKRVIADIPKDLHRSMKVKLSLECMTVRKLVTRLILRWVDIPSKKKA